MPGSTRAFNTGVAEPIRDTRWTHAFGAAFGVAFGVAAVAFFASRPDVVVFATVLWSAFFLVMQRAGYLRLAVLAAICFWLLVYAGDLTFGVRPRSAGAYSGLLISAFAGATLAHRHLPRRARVIPLVTLYAAAVVAILVAAAFLAHYLIFAVPITSAELYAIFQTDLREVTEFVTNLGGIEHVAMAAAILLIPLPFLFGLRPATRTRSTTVTLIVLFAISLVTLAHYRRSLGLFGLIADSGTSYRAELGVFREMRDGRLAGVVPVSATKEGVGETYVIVIGESLNRNHMGLYGYHRSTTPRLAASHAAGELIRFDHAYSTHTHTMPVLAAALTAANQRVGRDALTAPSILDVVNAAGFETYWITNQVLYGPWDNLVSILAHGADHLIPLNRGVGQTTRTSRYDGAAVDVLQDVLGRPTDGNRVIFVHLMGSHPRYCSRFPPEFSTFGGDLAHAEFGRALDKERDRVTDWVNCYDNSVLYNDHVVSGLLGALKGNGGVAAFLYFADHGQDVLGGNLHHSSRFVHSMVEIPMLVWTSEGYRAVYGGRVAALGANRGSLFPTDFVFDTAIGLTGIRTTEYDVLSDLTSGEYRVDDVELRMLNGERELVGPDHVRFHLRENLRMLAEMGLLERVLPHRVNTRGKLARVLHDEARGIEVDLLVRTTGSGGYFEVGHGESSATGMSLSTLLDGIPTGAIKKLWLDVKNLDAGNTEAAVGELERLHALLDLKGNAIVESPSPEHLQRVGEAGFLTSYYLPTSLLERLGARADTDSLFVVAGQISRDVRRYGIAAVSFDAGLYPIVKRYLEPSLPPTVVYHTWDLDLSLSSSDFSDSLAATATFADPRVATILVRYPSEFDY